MRFQLTSVRSCAIAALLLLAACDSPQEREAEYLKNGKALYESGDLSKAAIEFRNALQINPAGAEAKYFTGLIYEKKGNLPRAISAYQEVALQDPNNRDVQLKLGQYALMNGDAAEASMRADRLIALDSSKPDGHTMKAAAFMIMGKLTEAETEAKAALALHPNDEDATIVLASQRARQGKFDEAEAIVKEALAANPKSVQLLGFKLKLLSDQHRTAEVEQVLRQLVELDPANPSHVVNLANVLTQAGRLPEAQEEFRRAIAANSKSTLLLAAYADFLDKQAGTDEAIDEAKRLAEQFKGNALYSFLLARLYIKANRLDAADNLLKRLVQDFERSSDRLDAQVELARIALLRGDKQGALDQLATILKTDSKNENALLLRATIKLKDAKFDDAIADARAVLSDAPTSAPALAILAKAYAATNEHELAIGALRNLARVVPNNADVHIQLAGLLVTRAPNEAVKELDAAIALRPDNAELKAQKAQILIYTKRWDQGEIIGQQLAADQKTVALGHQILGEAAFARQDFPTAIKELQSAIDHGRSFSVVGPKLMEAYKQADQPVNAAKTGTDETSPAEQLLLDRIAKDPKDADALALLSAQREAKGDLAAAKDLLRQAMEAKPDERAPYLNLARILKKEGNLKEASETLQAAAARFPDDSLVLESLAIGYELMLDYPAARTAYENVLAKWPGDIVAANNLAMLIADVWPTDKALLDRARRLVEEFRNSNNPTLIDTLGWVQVRLGNIDDATIILKKAASMQPDNQQVLYHYAAALSLKGLDDLARDNMTKALAGDPTFRGLDDAKQLAAKLQ
ncbi:MAG TPA: tetratricopeptide repeat protein [Dongiaceae bacterium]|jgi:tetratricopeptide (TPR) repeat protein|nr:tetratricopeptide repeat protein [Dongiaceae bacterium]